MMREGINRFRERVGGNIGIFLYSCSLLTYLLVLVPATFYYLYKQEWKLAYTSLVLSVFVVAMARVLFHLLHWWLNKFDQVFNWMRKR